MPPGTTGKERRQGVMEVLEDLYLTHRKDVQISGLSGGQQKRVSIGVELLTKPFTAEALARKIRQVLSSSSRAV